MYIFSICLDESAITLPKNTFLDSFAHFYSFRSFSKCSLSTGVEILFVIISKGWLTVHVTKPYTERNIVTGQIR